MIMSATIIAIEEQLNDVVVPTGVFTATGLFHMENMHRSKEGTQDCVSWHMITNNTPVIIIARVNCEYYITKLDIAFKTGQRNMLVEMACYVNSNKDDVISEVIFVFQGVTAYVLSKGNARLIVITEIEYGGAEYAHDNLYGF